MVRELGMGGLVCALVFAAGSAQGQEKPPERYGSVFIDPLGFALFGPRLGVEAGAGHFTGALTARWFNPGLLSRSLFLDDGATFNFSYGAGLRGRYYLKEALEGGHFGVAVEYLRTSIEDASARIVTEQTYLVPYAEGGYRLAFGSFYGDLSAGLGYAKRLSGKVENLPGGNNAANYYALDESSVYGTASLELGYLF
jgi:hypothetical protein